MSMTTAGAQFKLMKNTGVYAGVKNAVIREYAFITDDGLKLTWTNYKRGGDETADIVALLHGNTNSSDIFTSPTEYNLVNYFLDNGYTDVWSLDWRSSKRFGYNRMDKEWSCDDVALYDMPAAFKCLGELNAGKYIYVMAHCIGSLTLSMAISAGLVTNVHSLCCHSVHLVTRFRGSNTIKLALSNAFFGKLAGIKHIPLDFKKHVNGSGLMLIKPIAALTSKHCNDETCMVINFIHSSTAHGLFEHHRVPPQIHARLKEIFDDLPLSIYAHIMHMNLKGVAVKLDDPTGKYKMLPDNYMENAAEMFDFPVLFLAGAKNKVWFDSCKLSYSYLTQATEHHQYELEIIPDYGHMDVFWCAEAHLNVFPKIVDFFDRHRIA